ncbi:MAG: DNA-directed RNA polymerase subunit omega [Nitrospirae bacterium]|nr:MAG: DNA-directed RNA polymerase subunit omega [Nitrospirota bacterium]
MDIISLPIEFDKEKIESRFRLVNIAVQRAKALADGARPKIETDYKKLSTIALLEAVQGKIEFITGEKAIEAQEAARKRLELRKMLEEERPLDLDVEDLSVLEKDLQQYMKSKSEEELDIEDIFGSEENE